MNGTTFEPTQDQSAWIGKVVGLGFDNLTCPKNVMHFICAYSTLKHAADGVHAENKLPVTQEPLPTSVIRVSRRYHIEGNK